MSAVSTSNNDSDFLSVLRSKLASVRCLVVVGIGSVLRGDDAAGVVLTQKIDELIGIDHPRVMTVNGGTAVESVTGGIIKAAPSHVLFVDAADLGLTPGCCCLIDETKIAGVTFSTHMLPLNIIVDYLKMSLGAESQLLVVGIQPKNIDFCADICLSPEVATSVDQLAQTICQAMTVSP